MFNKACWIWKNDVEEKDSYVSFLDSFTFNGSGEVKLKICAETNYVAYINDKKVSFGQYPNYPNEKYYDEIDVKDFCLVGENKLNITVWYEGVDTFTHIDDGAGLIYTVESNENILAYSSEETLSGSDTNYLDGQKQFITIQVGYTSKMVSDGKIEYKKSKKIEKSLNFLPRPVKKLVEEPIVNAKKISQNVYDLGAETGGYLSVEFLCEKECNVTVSYGEYLKEDGTVPRLLPGGYKNVGRDFSLEFFCKKGENTFTNYFLRVAGRYLEIKCDENIIVNKLGVIPVYYPLSEKSFDLSGIDKEIYNTCVRTLRLCMHEHYEDCPWREQALYSLDSRNQMLCGYYAFNDYQYQRANLVFISKGTRADGILELTYPAINTPAIPFFSLIYVVAVGEYIEHTGDYSILDSVFETVSRIMEFFKTRIDDKGLIPNLPEPFWNFYEWTIGSDNSDELVEGTPRVYKHDLMLNCAYLYAFRHYEKMLKYFGEESAFNVDKMKNSIKNTFFDKNREEYYLSDIGEKYYSQLGNAFAILVGLGDKSLAEKLISDDTLIQATLSMSGFVYDAILHYDDKFSDYILSDIRKKYGYMLSKGATSFWEVLSGIEEDDAQSLCHGWSAMPIYYYNKFFNKK